MDLKIYEGKILFHMIDHARPLFHKKTEPITNTIMKYWVAVYRLAEKSLTDNGEEFVNNHLLNLCEALNIKLQTAGEESSGFKRLNQRKTKFCIVRNVEQSIRVEQSIGGSLLC